MLLTKSRMNPSRCGNHGCDGHQGPIRITSAYWMAHIFLMTLLSKGNGGNIYSDLPASPETEHPPPVLVAPQLETRTGWQVL